MTQAAQEVIQSFNVLPMPDQQIVLVEICRQAAQWDSEPLSEGELCRQADELFQMLDERERQDGAG
jgi:hypothetical protein